MCTVTFLPLAENSYILTSNRDESPLRPAAIPPRKHKISGKHLFFPQDPAAGGTWIATGDNNFTLCLLNGAFEKHNRETAYRMSRGKMLLSFFRYSGVEDFSAGFDFSGIEPFTLIAVDSNHALVMHELRWDGQKIFHRLKEANEPHIWSSATLYDKPAQILREKWFGEWLGEHPSGYTMEDIVGFHTSGGEKNDEIGLVMNRSNIVRTLSVTSIQRDDHTCRISYFDILADKATTYRILQSAEI